MSEQSNYCYPGTDVLVNKANIREQEHLSRYEDVVTSHAIAELYEKNYKGQFDFNHLKNIHFHIFHEIYPFAGQVRTEDISKGFAFARCRFIDGEAAKLFGELAREDHLTKAAKHLFAERAAYYMAEINVLHPSREGNGRTQREFIRQLAMNAGYVLDWTRVGKDIAMQAFVRSKSDTRDLAEIMRFCIANEQPQREVWMKYRGIARNLER